MSTSQHAWARELAKQLKVERPLIVVDTETTGTDPVTDRIVQLGYVRIDTDGEVTEKEMNFNPGQPIPPDATKVHGISNLDVEVSPTFRSMAAELASTLEGDLVGYNVKFDAKILWYEFRSAEVKWKVGRLLDPCKIYQSYYPRDLASAFRHYLNEEHHGAHTALADARAAGRILLKQLQFHAELPQNVTDLNFLQFVKPPEGYADADAKIWLKDGKLGLNFGKFKGRAFEEVPRVYLKWILENDFSKQIKEIIRDWDLKNMTGSEYG